MGDTIKNEESLDILFFFSYMIAIGSVLGILILVLCFRCMLISTLYISI